MFFALSLCCIYEYISPLWYILQVFLSKVAYWMYCSLIDIDIWGFWGHSVNLSANQGKKGNDLLVSRLSVGGVSPNCLRAKTQHCAGQSGPPGRPGFIMIAHHLTSVVISMSLTRSWHLPPMSWSRPISFSKGRRAGPHGVVKKSRDPRPPPLPPITPSPYRPPMMHLPPVMGANQSVDQRSCDWSTI